MEERHALLDRPQCAQRLMPPCPNDAFRLHFLLLVMRAAVFALVERVLYPDVRLHLALRRLQAHEPRDLERVADLDLRTRREGEGRISMLQQSRTRTRLAAPGGRQGAACRAAEREKRKKKHAPLPACPTGSRP